MTTRYTVIYAPRAQRDLRKLPEKIATACVEFVGAVLTEDPHRVGKPLTSSWEGYYSARRSEWRTFTASMTTRSSSRSSPSRIAPIPTGHADPVTSSVH